MDAVIMEEVDRVCSWCGAKLGTKRMPRDPSYAGVPTHGVCPQCAAGVFRGLHAGDRVCLEAGLVGCVLGFLETERGAVAVIELDGGGRAVRLLDEVAKISSQAAEVVAC
jgi:hypothetical protein